MSSLRISIDQCSVNKKCLQVLKYGLSIIDMLRGASPRLQCGLLEKKNFLVLRSLVSHCTFLQNDKKLLQELSPGGSETAFSIFVSYSKFKNPSQLAWLICWKCLTFIFPLNLTLFFSLFVFISFFSPLSPLLPILATKF